MENKTVQSNFSVTRIQKTSSRDYTDAIKIYNDTTPNEIKTNADEITSILAEDDYEDFKPFAFILRYNDKTLGFAFLIYLKESRSLLIEYLALDASIRSNSSFLIYLGLLKSYFSDVKLDLSYWLVEISFRNNGKDVDKESRFFRKLLYLENYGKANAPYHTLQIGPDNFESSFEANIYLKSDCNDLISTISRKTYVQIVQNIYNYSKFWFNKFNGDTSTKEHEERIKLNLSDIKKMTKKSDHVTIEYSNSDSIINKDYFENTSKILPTEKTFSWKRNSILISVGLIFGLSLIYIVNKILNYFGIVMSEISSIVASMFTIIFSPIVSVLVGKDKNKS